MKDGKYCQIDWSQYECDISDFLQNRIVKSYDEIYDTCGTPALATLTGLTAKFVDSKLPFNKTVWSDHAVVKFLKNRNFKVRSVSKFSVTCLPREENEFEELPINKNHVLLCNLLCCKDEASWFIVHGNNIYHNFEKFSLDPLFFINKPSQTIWMIYHDSWNKTKKIGKRVMEEIKPKRRERYINPCNPYSCEYPLFRY